jgi:hypothetical protein
MRGWRAALSHRSGVTRALIGGGGGGYIHIFVFYPTNFFWNELKNKEIQKKFVGQNTNMWIYTPPPAGPQLTL